MRNVFTAPPPHTHTPPVRYQIKAKRIYEEIKKNVQEICIYVPDRRKRRKRNKRRKRRSNDNGKCTFMFFS